MKGSKGKYGVWYTKGEEQSYFASRTGFFRGGIMFPKGLMWILHENVDQDQRCGWSW